MNTPTITLTLTVDEAWNLKQRCADSASMWHQLWQDASDGKRPDLDANACLALNRQAWKFYEQLESLGAVA